MLKKERHPPIFTRLFCKINSNNRDRVQIFGIKGSAGMGFALDLYFKYVFFAVLLFYMTIVSALSEAFRYFNRELKQFGEKTAVSVEQLSKLYDKQINLVDLLQKINSTFEVSRSTFTSSQNSFRFSVVFQWVRRWLS